MKDILSINYNNDDQKSKQTTTTTSSNSSSSSTVFGGLQKLKKISRKKSITIISPKDLPQPSSSTSPPHSQEKIHSPTSLSDKTLLFKSVLFIIIINNIIIILIIIIIIINVFNNLFPNSHLLFIYLFIYGK